MKLILSFFCMFCLKGSREATNCWQSRVGLGNTEGMIGAQLIRNCPISNIERVCIGDEGVDE